MEKVPKNSEENPTQYDLQERGEDRIQNLGFVRAYKTEQGSRRATLDS